MKLSDFLIIYLASGAPFGMYFFLLNRKKYNSVQICLRSALAALAWIPYALRLLHDFITKNFFEKTTKTDSTERKLDALEKRLSQILLESGAPVSLFEFRETVERYAGLTLACRNADQSRTFPAGVELYRIALRGNVALAAKCLDRRNRRRLEAHQISAREDFLQAVTVLKNHLSDPEILCAATAEFADVLGDFQAQCALGEIFEKPPQSLDSSSVRQLENEYEFSTSTNRRADRESRAAA